MHSYIKDFAPEFARRLISYAIDGGHHLLISGPRGSGKTRLAADAAAEHGRPLEVFHLAGATDIEATLLGTASLKNAETHFSRARFVHAITKPFTVVVLDEANRALGGTGQGLMLSCMDDSRRLMIDQEGDPEQRVVDIAQGVVFIATANVGAEYHGTQPFDAALLDRMLNLELGYSDCEMDLLRAHGLSKPNARRVMNLASSIRGQCQTGALTESISTRGLVSVAKMMNADFTVQEAFEAVVGVWDDESRAALRATLTVTP
jgi:nitric oxide reductase NorQ protein